MANKAKVKPGKSILLEAVPVEVQRILIEKTAAEGENCKCTRGQDYALYKIVKEWKAARSPGLFFMVDGQLTEVDPEVSFQGGRVCITFSVPITSPVGAVLNYRRIESAK